MDFNSLKVHKTSGAVEPFRSDKIRQSIWAAAESVGGTDRELPQKLAQAVRAYLAEAYPHRIQLNTNEIGEAVEKVLIEDGHAQTAKAYILYRENRRHLHQRMVDLEVEDDIGLHYNTLFILKKRYLQRDSTGKTVETPRELIHRVAKFLSDVESKSQRKAWYQRFYEVMHNFEFFPGTRTLANSGKKEAQLANCFVWPIEDDFDHVFRVLYQSSLIKKHGGGCGYNFSAIRPEADVVNGIPDIAAGPVRMIEMFDLMTSMFRQEGRYESGNMVVLNADHPDIFNFISAKQNDGYLSKTNISVGITDEFMQAAIDGKNWDLINPRTQQVVNTVKARSILELMARMAWQTGDPGILNLSAINRGTAMANPLLEQQGPIHATNVCGEIPLYPYESCNLGYVNLAELVREQQFDFKRLEELMMIAVRMLDNVIDAAWFPVEEVTQAVKNHRRIGIGCVGWAEALIKLKIPYDSERAFNLAEKVAQAMYQTAFQASVEYAQEKGPFPYVNKSIWANRKQQPRNVALITFPPSSGNAVICNTSFAIEPLFALAYEQNILDGVRLKNVNELLVQRLKSANAYSDDLILQIINNHGSVQGLSQIPHEIQRVFKVAHDIHWKDHIRMQAAFQKWTDNAITKTINMEHDITPEDVYDAYVMAWKLGCKGLTIYRDASKKNQVFDFGNQQQLSRVHECPDCQNTLVRVNGCLKCKKCGFSVCER